MAMSELHSRLEHLVNYSSQLIFVSGDKINQQSQIIDAFLGHQSENTEVAIIKATKNFAVNEYRNQIFKQLIGSRGKGDIGRPLNQLLVELNDYDGPVLISISQAEYLPQTLLQELWELVLQSRFANNKQHLNVLLFAEPLWAEQAKTWLPAGTGNKPILLSSQSISTEDLQDSQTDLEKLIHTKREQFAQRIKGRAEHYQPITPVLAKRGLLSLISIVFIGVFGGLLWWQYPEVTLSVLSKLSATPPVTDEDLTAPALMSGSAVPKTMPQEPTIADTEQSLPEPEQHTPAEEPMPLEVADPNAPITDWQSALEQIDKAALNQAKTEALITVTKAPASANQMATDSENNPVNDYPIEDITSIEQLNIQTGAADALAPAIQTETIPQGTELEQGGNVVYEFDEGTLLLLAEDRYLLQIAAMSSIQAMQEYIKDKGLEQQLWIYKTIRQSSDWYVLLHNKDYVSLVSARAASTGLPPSMQQGVPFAKTSRQVQIEINPSTN